MRYLYLNGQSEIRRREVNKTKMRMRELIDVPEEFNKIMVDFLTDLLLAFPEYKES